MGAAQRAAQRAAQLVFQLAAQLAPPKPIAQPLSGSTDTTTCTAGIHSCVFTRRSGSAAISEPLRRISRPDVAMSPLNMFSVEVFQIHNSCFDVLDFIFDRKDRSVG